RGTDKLRTAYGFESATIEVVDSAGPVLVTALATGIGRLAGLAAMLVCALGGTLALAAQRSTEPEPAGPPSERRPAMGSLRIPALRSLYAARLCTGGVFGAMPVAVIAFATAHHVDRVRDDRGKLPGRRRRRAAGHRSRLPRPGVLRAARAGRRPRRHPAYPRRLPGCRRPSQGPARRGPAGGGAVSGERADSHL